MRKVIRLIFGPATEPMQRCCSHANQLHVITGREGGAATETHQTQGWKTLCGVSKSKDRFIRRSISGKKTQKNISFFGF